MVLNVTTDILSRLPDYFDLEVAQQKYNLTDNQGLNIVLIHELERYNSLLQCIRHSLNKVQRAIQVRRK